MGKFVIFFVVCVLVVVQETEQIITRDEGAPKPQTYTAGIKTAGYRKPVQQIQVHHNYSRVYHHNNLTNIDATSQESSPDHVFPIYNAHSYGATPQQSQHYTHQSYVLNETKISNLNPTRTIVIHRRKKESPKIEVYSKCPPGATGQFVYELSCNQFLNCWKGRGYPQNCAAGTFFNPKTLECDHAEKVECITGPRQNTFRLERHLNVKQVNCPKEFTGLIPNYTDCSKFINCNNGIEHPMDCPPGTLFDINKNICDFEDKAFCFNGQNVKQSTQIDEKLDFGSSHSGKLIDCSTPNTLCHREPKNYRPSGYYEQVSSQGTYYAGQKYQQGHGQGLQDGNHHVSSGGTYAGQSAQTQVLNQLHQTSYGGQSQDTYSGQGSYSKQSHNTLSSQAVLSGKPYGYGSYHDVSETHQGAINNYEVKCPNNAAGLFRHPFDCSKFLNCANGMTYVQNCGPGTHFNPTSLVCDFPHNVRCELGSATPGSGQQNFGDIGSGASNFVEVTSSNSYGGYESGGTYHQTGQGHGKPSLGGPTRPGHLPGFATQRPAGYVPSTSSGGAYQQSGTAFVRIPGWPSSTQKPCQGPGDCQYSFGTSGASQNQNGRPCGSSNNCQSSGFEISDNNRQSEFVQVDPVPQGFKPCQNSNNCQFGSSTPLSGQNSYEPSGIHQSSQYGSTNLKDSNQLNVGSKTQPNGCDQSGNCQHGSHHRQSGRPCSSSNNCSPSSEISGNNQQSVFVQVGSEVHGFKPCQNSNNCPTSSATSLPGQNSYGQSEFHQSSQYGSTNTPTDSNYLHLNTNKQPNGCNQFGNCQFGSHEAQRPSRGHQSTSNYDQVININSHLRSTTPSTNKWRNPQISPRPTQLGGDYDDTFNPSNGNHVVPITPRSTEKHWPPPFPQTDVNADYVFEYEDGDEVTLEAENILDLTDNRNKRRREGQCQKGDLRCTNGNCIPRTSLCDNIKDCNDGSDEINCIETLGKFEWFRDSKLAVLEKERWDNVTMATCAALCIGSQKFRCKSFNYRKIDRTCFLTNTNIALSGALIAYYPCDYYELRSEQLDCTDMFKCSNNRCINRTQICDGQNDCGDRMDEKGCKPKDFGYSIRLTGTSEKHEGQIEVTAFGKTGYICDDKFGLRDGNVVCKELGYHLGAAEIRGNSYYAKKSSEFPFYMMDDVTCLGNETSLMDCDFSGWGVHNCGGQEIAGVVCKTPQEKCAKDYWQCDTRQECLPLAFVCDGLLDCTDGSDEAEKHCDAPTEIRLANGSSKYAGRLEIRHHGTWGTVCDDDFNEDAAKVVCKQLGFKGSATVKKDGYFGPGDGPIWLDQVFCSGNETSIEFCTHWNWGEHNCEHSEDVGVICSDILQTERHSLSSITPAPFIPEVLPIKCGFRKDNQFNINDNIHARVVKGSVAEPGNYPWQAAIRVKGKAAKAAHWCGAVIISDKFLLTAAHCLVGYSKGAYIIVAGDYNVDEDEGTEQEGLIEDYYIHEDFRKGHKMNNDIALIKLKGRGFVLNQDVQPICLPEETTDYEQALNCTISGFGSIKSGVSGFSHELRAGWIPVQTKNICRMPHVYGENLTDGMFCAGSLDEGVDACDGDSGGPLACLDTGLFTLYGITSWGQHCGYANKPGVYVNVAHYRRWIDDIIRTHSTTR